MSSKTNKGHIPTNPQSKGMEKKNRIDAANMAKRKKEFEVDSDPKKTLKYQDWTQTADEIQITLFAGRKLSSNDINVEFTNYDVKVSLTDGRRWYCQFNREIKLDSSRVQLSKNKMKIILHMIKNEQGISWRQLEYNSEENELSAPCITPSTSGSKSSSPSTGRVSRNSQSPVLSADRDNNSQITSQLRSVDSNTLNEASTQTNTTSNPADVACSGDGPNISPPVSDTKKISLTQELDSKDAPDSDSVKFEESVYELDHVKNDFYEKGADVIVATVFVKQIDKDSIKVHFGDRELWIKFRSKDPKFHSLHPGTSEDTVFKWSIQVVDDLNKECCKHKVTSTSIELTLVKTDPRKWGALEASQARSARVAPTTSDWQPANSSAKSLRDSKSCGDLDEVRLRGETAVNKNAKETSNEKDNKPSTSGLGSRPTILPDSNRDVAIQKPTCMVSPLNKSEYESGLAFSLGMTGLDNLGNTCFMNSVLQVLANTKELRDYFLDGLFQKEINHDNVLGTGGKLSVAFATLMKVLWSGKYRSYAPAKLKNLVAMKNNQFMGFAQHDAQEFLAFLLDGLHEDQNRVVKKPYTQDVDSDGRPDEVVANEAWERYKSRNDSYIVDLFQGQYKSKLVCPMCSKVSITFDPFMHLSVPLPKKKKRLLAVTFMYRDPYKKPVKYMLRLPKDAVTDDLKELMYQKTGIPPSRLRVFESYKNKIQTIFYRGTTLNNVSISDKIFVCEILTEKQAGEPVLEVNCLQRTLYPVSVPIKCSNCKRECNPAEKLKRCTKCFKTAYCDQSCQKQDWSRHRPSCTPCNELVGQPFIVSLPASQATFSRLAQTMEAFARYSLDVFQPPIVSSSTFGPHATSNQSDSCTPSATDMTRPCETSSSCTKDCTQVDSQNSLESQSSPGTSTTEVASTSSEGSFITVESGSIQDENSSDNLIPPEKGELEWDGKTEAYKEIGPKKPVDSQPFEKMALDSEESLVKEETLTPPTRFVMGRQQDLVDRDLLPFSIRACDKAGRTLPGESGHKLKDTGDAPLKLEGIPFLALDWLNHEKCTPYVLVQSKEMECEEDESLQTVYAEESSNITLDHCMSLFTEPEVLSPDHAWYCPQCKEHREATKQLSIWRLPAYLIIQLKRFSFSSFIWRDKIDKIVEFPIRGLDLSKHFVGKLPSTEPPPIYDLYGVVNHMGGILGGHYTSYARCPDATDWRRNELGWRLFDDSMVSNVSENQVMSRAGYVLFYKRRDMTVSIPRSLSESSDKISSDDESKLAEKSESDDTEILDNRFVNNEDTEDNDIGNTLNTGIYTTMSNSQSIYSFTDMDTVD